ncbi:MAG: ABC transporter ATP-binding protein [Thermoguttaceae bacterium]
MVSTVTTESSRAEADAIALENVTCEVGKARLLDDVSFCVRAHSHAAIVGPNGAGKTTLLRCIARLLEYSGGTIRVGGVDVRTIPRRSLAQQVAYLSQSPESLFAFTVRQVVEMGRYPHQRPLAPLSSRDRSVVESALDLTQTTQLANRVFATLSGGERQKVSLAAILAQEPQILLLDEPTTFLDYNHQQEMRRVLNEINRQQGTTILAVTHDLNAVSIDCDHVIALTGGHIFFSGPPSELITQERLKLLFGVGFETVTHPTLGATMVVPS